MGMDDKRQYRLQIGNYRLLKKISAGTSGIVYQGQHNIFTDEPLVAIKQLRAQLNSPKEQNSFIQEARLLRRLKHKLAKKRYKSIQHWPLPSTIKW